MKLLGKTMTLLGNRYQLLQELGAGGMGSVHRALDQLTGQHLALKRVLLMNQSSSDSQSSERDNLRLALANEFRTLASLRHPHIISVMDYGFDQERQPYFTMELLDNPQTILLAGQDKSVSEKIQLLFKTLQALAYLHRRGVIHCDLKPHNILVHQDKLRVLDFGLALNREQNQDGLLAGTIAYMAPEILGGEPASIASDLYAVGTIAYELLAGKHPFDTHNLTGLIRQIMYEEVNITDLADIDGSLASVVGRLLAKNPEERYADADAVIQALCEAVELPIPDESKEIRESFLQAADFVGRKQELSQLLNAFDETMKGKGSAWLIGGESGIGKSRLIDELRSRAMIKGALVLYAQATAEGGLSYLLWREILRRLLFTTEINDLEASILKEIIPDISKLLGRDIADAPPLESRETQERLIVTIIEIFKRQKLPIVLLAEDLHWSMESLEPLAQLSELVANYPWMLVGTYRDDEAPDLPKTLAKMQRLRLERFSEDAITELSTAMLGETGQESELVKLLQQETEGNAFFLVEVVRALAEEAGSLKAIGTDTLPRQVLTGGVLKLMRRRLAKAPDWAQAALKLAAVAGRQLDLSLLAQMQQLDSWEDWLTVCANLAILESNQGRWRFSHDKLRETLLADLSDDERRSLNRQVAAALESAHPDDDNYAEVLARYWEQADDKPKTIHYLLRGIEHLIGLVADYRHAEDLIQHGLSMTSDKQMQAQFQGLSGDVALKRADYPKAKTHFAACLELESPSKLKALHGLANVHYHLGNFDEAEKSARKLLDLAGKPFDKALGLCDIGMVATGRGDYALAIANYQEALIIQRELEKRPDVARTLSQLGAIAYVQGNYPVVENYLKESLEISREIGDRRSTAATLTTLGMVGLRTAQLPQAHRSFDESLSIYSTIGDRQGMASCLNGLGEVGYYQGDMETARHYHERCLALRRELGNQQGTAISLSNLGNLANARRDYDAGQAYHQEALEIYRNIGSRSGIAWILSHLATSSYIRHDWSTARKLAGESLQLQRELGEKAGIDWVCYLSAFIEYVQQNYQRARDYVEESLAIAQELGHEQSIVDDTVFLVMLDSRQRQPEAARQKLRSLIPVVRRHKNFLMTFTLLYGATHLLIAEGDLRKAAEYLGFVKRHEEAIDLMLPIIEALILELETKLGTAFSEAFEAGTSAEAETLFANLYQFLT
jgi:tetratricopeptide (TPR) repeat protein